MEVVFISLSYKFGGGAGKGVGFNLDSSSYILLSSLFIKEEENCQLFCCMLVRYLGKKCLGIQWPNSH